MRKQEPDSIRSNGINARMQQLPACGMVIPISYGSTRPYVILAEATPILSLSLFSR